jgi:hypothetical protein
MKKKIALVLLLLAGILAVLVIGSLRDEPLGAAAREALNYQSQVPATENAFVALAGFNAAAESDFIRAGAERIQRGKALRDEEVYTKELTFSDTYELPDNLPPCLTDSNRNCLEDVAAKTATIQKLLDENRLLLQRYQKIQGMAQFADNDTSLLFFAPAYGDMIQASNMLCAAAVKFRLFINLFNKQIRLLCIP